MKSIKSFNNKILLPRSNDFYVKKGALSHSLSLLQVPARRGATFCKSVELIITATATNNLNKTEQAIETV